MTAATSDTAAIVALPLDQLHPADDNPRGDVGDVAELAASIASVGLVHPLLVAPRGAGGWTVVAGHRRLAALQLAGAAAADCVVRDLDDAQRREIMLVENCQRADLTALEEARAYRGLLDLGYSQRKVAERVGRNQSHVSRRLTLLDLPDTALTALEAGGITVADALALTKLKAMPTVIATIVAAGGGGDRIEWQVNREVAELDRLRTRDATLARLREAGAAVVDLDDCRHTGDLSYRGHKEIALGRGYDLLGVDPETHAGERCHAVGVLHGGGEVALCTKPAGHPKAYAALTNTNSGPLSDEQKADRARQRELNKRVAAALERRAPVLAGLLAAPITVDVLEHIAHVAVLNDGYNHQHERNLACEYLGLELVKTTWGGESAGLTLTEHAATGKAARLRVALALTLAAGEFTPRTLRAGPGNWSSQLTRAHFAFLQAHGHTLDPVEAELLAGRPAQDPVMPAASADNGARGNAAQEAGDS